MPNEARRNEIRRWAVARGVAGRREREERRRAPVSPRLALKQALALISLAASRHGWPLPETEKDRIEDEVARACWRRLQLKLRPR